MLYTTVAQIGFVAMAAVCAFTILFGKLWGRTAAALYTANWMLAALVQDRRVGHFHAADMAVDAVGAVLATALALKAGSGWAISFAAFQILGVTHYILELIDNRVTVNAAIVSSYLWELGALMSLFLAGCDRFHHRRAR